MDDSQQRPVLDDDSTAPISFITSAADGLTYAIQSHVQPGVDEPAGGDAGEALLGGEEGYIIVQDDQILMVNPGGAMEGVEGIPDVGTQYVVQIEDDGGGGGGEEQPEITHHQPYALQATGAGGQRILLVSDTMSSISDEGQYIIQYTEPSGAIEEATGDSVMASLIGPPDAASVADSCLVEEVAVDLQNPAVTENGVVLDVARQVAPSGAALAQVPGLLTDSDSIVQMDVQEGGTITVCDHTYAEDGQSQEQVLDEEATIAGTSADQGHPGNKGESQLETEEAIQALIGLTSGVTGLYTQVCAGGTTTGATAFTAGGPGDGDGGELTYVVEGPDSAKETATEGSDEANAERGTSPCTVDGLESEREEMGTHSNDVADESQRMQLKVPIPDDKEDEDDQRIQLEAPIPDDKDEEDGQRIQIEVPIPIDKEAEDGQRIVLESPIPDDQEVSDDHGVRIDIPMPGAEEGRHLKGTEVDGRRVRSPAKSCPSGKPAEENSKSPTELRREANDSERSDETPKRRGRPCTAKYTRIGGIFRCNQCRKTFATLASVQGHQAQHATEERSAESKKQNGMESRERESSKMKLATLRSLDLHRTSEDGRREKQFRCVTCNCAFATKTQLDAHTRLHKTEVSFGCDICCKTFRLKQALAMHMRIHREKPARDRLLKACPACDATFRTQASLSVHMRAHEPSAKFQCERCSECFSGKRSLKQHMKKHPTGKNTFCCPLCSQEFEVKATMDAHVKRCRLKKATKVSRGEQSGKAGSVAGIRKPRVLQENQCAICYNVYRTAKSLLAHTKLHESGLLSKKVQNNTSDSVEPTVRVKTPKVKTADVKTADVKTADAKTADVKTEPDVRGQVVDGLQCRVCKKVFGKHHSLAKHMLAHDSPMDHRCSMCDAAFPSRAELTRHMDAHPELPRPHSCDVCGHRFAHKSRLIVHQRVHDRERQKKRCWSCKKTFPWPTEEEYLQHQAAHQAGSLPPEEKNAQQEPKKRRGRPPLKSRAGPAIVTGERQQDEADSAFKKDAPGKDDVETGGDDADVECQSAVSEASGKVHEPNQVVDGSVVGDGDDDRGFSCDQCGQVFPMLKGLRNHLLVHGRRGSRSGESSSGSGLNGVYVCKSCPKVFASRLELCRHADTHQKLECHVCGVTFQTRRIMLKHVRLHDQAGTDECCAVCGVGMRHGDAGHVHTGEDIGGIDVKPDADQLQSFLIDGVEVVSIPGFGRSHGSEDGDVKMEVDVEPYVEGADEDIGLPLVAAAESAYEGADPLQAEAELSPPDGRLMDCIEEQGTSTSTSTQQVEVPSDTISVQDVAVDTISVQDVAVDTISVQDVAVDTIFVQAVAVEMNEGEEEQHALKSLLVDPTETQSGPSGPPSTQPGAGGGSPSGSQTKGVTPADTRATEGASLGSEGSESETNSAVEPTAAATKKRGRPRRARQSTSSKTGVKKAKATENRTVYHCVLCSRKVVNFAKLRFHMRLHRNDDGVRFTCGECEEEFPTPDLYVDHLIDAHDTRRLKRPVQSKKCPLCEEQLSYAFVRQHMEERHPGEKPYTCDKCGKGFVTPTYLSVHHKRHQMTRRHTCEFCGKAFQLPYQLKLHARTHTGERPYECAVCNRRFASYNYLKSHKFVHTKENPHACEICSRKFIRITHLRRHIATVHGDPLTKPRKPKTSHMCDICGKVVSSNYILLEHVRRAHFQEKSYACTYCDRRFYKETERIRHETNHTGKKPYLCSVCGKGFTRNHLLKDHMYKHTGNAPFACPQCDKKFARQPSLAVHMNTHGSKKEFSCVICNKAFMYRTNMMRHEKTHSNGAIKKRMGRKDKLPDTTQPYIVIEEGVAVEGQENGADTMLNLPVDTVFTVDGVQYILQATA